MSGDLHTDAGGWPDMHGRRAGLEPVPRPPRAADDAPLSEGADSPAPQPQLGDDHVPKPGQLDTLRWHANRVRSGTSSAASTGDDVIHSARLHADHPALASIKTDPGPGGATLAMSSLTPTDRQQVAHQTQSSAISDQQWESSMLTRATNPAYTPAEQQAWFSFAAAGRPAVQQAIDVGAHEAEGDWESGTAAAHTPSVQSSPSAPAPSAQPSPSPAAPPSPPSAPARPRQRRTAPSPPAPSAAPTPPRAAPAPPPPAAPASPPARPTPQPAPSSDPFADVPPPPDEPWDEEA
jgi:hypothetical protein